MKKCIENDGYCVKNENSYCNATECELENLQKKEANTNSHCNYCLEKAEVLPDGFGCQSCIDKYK